MSKEYIIILLDNFECLGYSEERHTSKVSLSVSKMRQNSATGINDFKKNFGSYTHGLQLKKEERKRRDGKGRRGKEGGKEGGKKRNERDGCFAPIGIFPSYATECFCCSLHSLQAS